MRDIQDYKCRLGDYLNVWISPALNNSELFCFFRICKELNVSRIIEVYVGNIFNARRLQLLFPGCDVIGIDPRKKVVNKGLYWFPGIGFRTKELQDSDVDKSTALMLSYQHADKHLAHIMKYASRASFVAGRFSKENVQYIRENYREVHESKDCPEDVKALDVGARCGPKLTAFW
jgi:hypothetical protein